MTTYVGFMDDANRYTLNLPSTTQVLYSPTSDLVILGGTCLGLATNNLAEYRVVIGLLTESLANDIRQIRVYLDLELVVHQLNRINTVCNPFRRVRILERYFEWVSYQHITIHLNIVADSLANFVLDWYLAHV